MERIPFSAFFATHAVLDLSRKEGTQCVETCLEGRRHIDEVDALLACWHRFISIGGELAQQFRLQGKQMRTSDAPHVHNLNVSRYGGVLVLEHHDLTEHRANANDVLKLEFARIVAAGTYNGHTGTCIFLVLWQTQENTESKEYL